MDKHSIHNSDQSSPSYPTMAEKKTKGKQKIEIKKINIEEDRMITFSKRRSGIYKKANELVVMCDVDVAFLVFSKSGTPFTFGHPSMEAVTERFKNPNLPRSSMDNATLVTRAYRTQRISELAKDYEKLGDELEVEREKGAKAEEEEVEETRNGWWNAPIDDLSDENRHRMHDAFVELHDNLCDLLAQRL
ncbi:PREDICTED: agamous-like MADS-box protein AGL61 [Tarenaya hassleriana]|uniref:agamous-like MADS-box protein AGL61 n=1 Tax=Tarenaya hassleriana TaxID=28532 RepID=UPI00053C1CF3|nr:PREDICTED: agamous-like MADS-box protein AGL61 [Tarenaya hassleriana]